MTTTPADYLMVRARVASALEDQLPELLDGLDVLGVEVGTADADGRVAVAICLTGGDEAGAARVGDLLAGRGALEVGCAPQAAEDWMAAYRRVVHPLAIGRTWWVDPHPANPTPAPAGRTRLVVEPRMAFGTGSHESTQLILTVIEDQPCAGRRVLDVGTGSGILSLACLARGAAWAVGVDNDAQSVWVARETALVQDRPWRPRFVVGSSGCIAAAGFDLVLCNMIVERFSPLLADLAAALAPGGALLLSGLLGEQRDEVVAALARVGLRPVAERRLAEWACLEVVR